MAHFAAIIAAAGEGSRVGLGYNKLLYRVDGKTVLEHTLERFDMPKFVVVSEQDEPEITALLASRPDVKVVRGGKTRGESVRNGLRACIDLCYTHVLVHDGARPLLHPDDLATCMRICAEKGSCVMTAPCHDTLRIDGKVLDRRRAMLMSTPQAFVTGKLLAAYNAVGTDTATDDASVWEQVWGRFETATLTHPNPKLTTYGDLEAFAATFVRIGTGRDEHKLADGRKCVLCGVTLPVPYGPLGHSDADVCIHALMDAMLGAAGLKDIGTYFPDTDPTYKDADSTQLLRIVAGLIAREGYVVGNACLVIHAQRPRLSPYIDAFRVRLAELLHVPVGAIGISATSGEGMGHIGRGEGIACDCVCTLRRTVV